MTSNIDLGLTFAMLWPFDDGELTEDIVRAAAQYYWSSPNYGNLTNPMNVAWVRIESKGSCPSVVNTDFGSVTIRTVNSNLATQHLWAGQAK